MLPEPIAAGLDGQPEAAEGCGGARLISPSCGPRPAIGGLGLNSARRESEVALGVRRRTSGMVAVVPGPGWRPRGAAVTLWGDVFGRGCHVLPQSRMVTLHDSKAAGFVRPGRARGAGVTNGASPGTLPSRRPLPAGVWLAPAGSATERAGRRRPCARQLVRSISGLTPCRLRCRGLVG